MTDQVYNEDTFYELDNGAIFCGECVNKWREDTKIGKLVEDEVFDPNLISGKAETPAQCDDCLKQSSDYDTVLDD